MTPIQNIRMALYWGIGTQLGAQLVVGSLKGASKISSKIRRKPKKLTIVNS